MKVIIILINIYFTGAIETDQLSMNLLSSVAPTIENECETTNVSNGTSNESTLGTKPSKKEGNQESSVNASSVILEKPQRTSSKPSRRTSSLLNLFMPQSQGMFPYVFLACF